MKKLVLLLPLLASQLVSIPCGPIYYQIVDAYIFQSNGPISPSQVSEFSPVLKSENNNAIPLDHVNSIYVYTKPLGHTEIERIVTAYRVAIGKYNIDINAYLDSLVQTMHKGDSLFITTFFKTTERMEGIYRYSSSNHRTESNYFYHKGKYEIESENMTRFSRNTSEYMSTYPNPAMTDLNLRINLCEAREGEYMVMTSQGVNVKSESLQNVDGIHSIDVSDLAAGTYILYVLIEGKPFYTKFIKLGQYP